MICKRGLLRLGLDYKLPELLVLFRLHVTQLLFLMRRSSSMNYSVVDFECRITYFNVGLSCESRKE
ncbi:MAG TPA: hypothetical protein DCZ95_15625 [Verrucomicrobia bacterium]|nr:MAG: hypothetical protein A2X46_02610 [Lentisphaerae bacterium GWF2_57_35]HBA85515.1 hypothetical protein [Verrucomicrobiota bacterium]